MAKVLWFESFYNFRVRQGYDMRPAHHPLFLGPCTKEAHGVCTHEALFHHHLALLGKTNASSPDEIGLFLPHPPRRRPTHERIPNQIFLYEISQLYSDNETRAVMYRDDLAKYLGLTYPPSPIVRGSSNRTGDESNNTRSSNHLDICEDMYKPLRDELLKNGRAASTWIRTFFMDHADVTVSSPEYFRELLLSWMEDPCTNRPHRFI